MERPVEWQAPGMVRVAQGQTSTGKCHGMLPLFCPLMATFFAFCVALAPGREVLKLFECHEVRDCVGTNTVVHVKHRNGS
jgi:hypothetical protein